MAEEKSKRGGRRPGAGRPKVSPEKKAVQAPWSIPRDVVQRVEDAARDDDLTPSKWVRQVLERSLRARGR